MYRRYRGAIPCHAQKICCKRPIRRDLRNVFDSNALPPPHDHLQPQSTEVPPLCQLNAMDSPAAQALDCLCDLVAHLQDGTPALALEQHHRVQLLESLCEDLDGGRIASALALLG